MVPVKPQGRPRGPRRRPPDEMVAFGFHQWQSMSAVAVLNNLRHRAGSRVADSRPRGVETHLACSRNDRDLLGPEQPSPDTAQLVRQPACPSRLA